MLKYAKTKRYKHKLIQSVQATDILYNKMMTYDGKAKEILSYLISAIRNSDKADYAKLKELLNKMKQFDDLVIDCAHKLAPYQSPKLESIEVKSKVEHRHVIRVPHQMKSTDEWMKATGASTLKENEIKREIIEKTIEPSIHDFDNDEEEDGYIEPGMLN